MFTVRTRSCWCIYKQFVYVQYSTYTKLLHIFTPRPPHVRRCLRFVYVPNSVFTDSPSTCNITHIQTDCTYSHPPHVQRCLRFVYVSTGVYTNSPCTCNLTHIQTKHTCRSASGSFYSPLNVTLDMGSDAK